MPLSKHSYNWVAFVLFHAKVCLCVYFCLIVSLRLYCLRLNYFFNYAFSLVHNIMGFIIF